LLFLRAMVYRKSPPRPTRLLLQIVSAVGTGAMVSVAACSSSPTAVPFYGSLPDPDASNVPDATDDVYLVYGSLADPDAESCCPGVVPNIDAGLLPNPHIDAGEADASENLDAGLTDASATDAAVTDAGADASHILTGTVVHPDE
jgi:hypothetical protein